MNSTCGCTGECGQHADKCDDMAIIILLGEAVKAFCASCGAEIVRQIAEKLVR